MRKGHTKGTAKAKKQTALSRDKLIKTTKKGDIELTEQELGKVNRRSVHAYRCWRPHKSRPPHKRVAVANRPAFNSRPVAKSP